MQFINSSKGVRFWLLVVIFLGVLLVGKINQLEARFFQNGGMLMLGKAFSAPAYTQKTHIMLRQSITFFEHTSAIENNKFQQNSAKYSITSDFYYRGKATKKLGDIEKSQQWFQYTTQLPATNELDWYYQGLAHLGLLQWACAQDAFERAAKATEYSTISSSLYYLGWLYQWHNEPRRLEDALFSYSLALELDKFESSYEKAEAYYHKGEILRWTNKDTKEIITALENALALAPNHVAARTLLGMVYYEQFENIVLAETEIYKALEINPQYKWAYLYLGDIYSVEDREDEAIKMYRKALEISPEDANIKEKIELLQQNEF